MGSPEGLMSACMARMDELGCKFYNDTETNACAMRKCVIHAGVEMPSMAVIDHSILYPGAIVNQGEIIENEIRGKGFKWNVPPTPVY